VLLQPQVRDKPCTVADIRIEEVTRGGSEDRPAPLRLKREILDRELDRVYEAKTLKGEVGTWGVGRGLDLLEGIEGPPLGGRGTDRPNYACKRDTGPGAGCMKQGLHKVTLSVPPCLTGLELFGGMPHGGGKGGGKGGGGARWGGGGG
jgi:hypothetical protein